MKIKFLHNDNDFNLISSLKFYFKVNREIEESIDIKLTDNKKIKEQKINHEHFSDQNKTDIIARTFNKYNVGDVIKFDSDKYIVVKLPKIDYNKTYLPFFLLIRNGFIKKVMHD